MTSHVHAPVIVPAGNFNPEIDAQNLRAAMKGFGTDEKAIMDILGYRSNGQRQQIALQYKTLFGRDLVDDLKSELGGNLEDVILALMTPVSDYLAKAVHKAIAGFGTNEATLIEIICPLSNSEIKDLNASYQRLYDKTLEDDLKGDTSGDFRRVLISLSTANRETNSQPERDRAMADANTIYKTGAGKWGTDEAVFISVFCCCSFPQLTATFECYKATFDRDIEKDVKGETSGALEDALIAIIKCAQNLPAFFAEEINGAVKGAGTKDDKLIRIIVSRAEKDLRLIKDVFGKLYGKSLESVISGETSGDYKKMLLHLLNEHR